MGKVAKVRNIKKSSEFFYLDKNGKKTDKALHEEILAGCKDPADVTRIGMEQARKCGLSEAEIAALYSENKLI